MIFILERIELNLNLYIFSGMKGLFLCFCATKKDACGHPLRNKLNRCNEGLHCDFACLLYSKLNNRLPEDRTIKIISSAVDIEMEFVIGALPVELIGF
jgi:hypothetical protein